MEAADQWMHVRVDRQHGAAEHLAAGLSLPSTPRACDSKLVLVLQPDLPVHRLGPAFVVGFLETGGGQ